MENKNHSKHILLVLAILLTASLACTIGGLSINNNTATLDIKLKEDQIMSLFERIVNQTSYIDSDVLQKLDMVELHEGYVSVSGTHTTAEKNDMSGNFDVSLGAENGVLQAEIIRVEIPGMNITDERIQQANEIIARELTSVVTETNGDVNFQRAEVHEDALYLTVSMKIRNTD